MSSSGQLVYRKLVKIILFGHVKAELPWRRKWKLAVQALALQFGVFSRSRIDLRLSQL